MGSMKLDALEFCCGFFLASLFAFLRDSFTFFFTLARWFVDPRLEVSAMYQEIYSDVVSWVFWAFLRTLSYADHGFGSSPSQEEGVARTKQDTADQAQVEIGGCRVVQAFEVYASHTNDRL